MVALEDGKHGAGEHAPEFKTPVILENLNGLGKAVAIEESGMDRIEMHGALGAFLAAGRAAAFRRSSAGGADNGADGLKRAAARRTNRIVERMQRQTADRADARKQDAKEITAKVADGMEHGKGKPSLTTECKPL